MAVLCTITYSNHFYNGFHFDDSHAVQNNAYIRNIYNIPLFFKDGSTSSSLPQNQAYRPVVVTSLAFDYWLGNGYNLFFFHFSTFILFLLQGLLMVWFFMKLFNISAPGSKRNTYAALIGVTFYLLHPAIAETVNYIIARADLQSTLAVLLGFVLYQYFAFCRKFYLYLIPIVIGALAKPPAVMFAPMLFVYLLFFDEKLSLYDLFKKSHFKQVAVVFKKSLPAFICFIVVYWLQNRFTPKTWVPGGSSVGLYLITQPYVILHYCQMFFVPNALSADTDWQLLHHILDWRFFIGALFILVMVVIAFITSKKIQLRPISFGILWFFLALIPTSSIIPLGEVLNDHRMFFPFVGLCISVSWTVALLFQKFTPLFSKYVPRYKIVSVLILCLILTTYAYTTYKRNEVWHTEESLWHDVTLKSPKNGRGLMNYGLTKMAAGDYVTADKYFGKALKLLPNYPSLYVNIAILKAATHNTSDAETYFKKGIWFGSTYPDPYLYYARFLNKQGRYTEAETNLKTALALSPANLYVCATLMDVYENTANWDELKKLALNTLQIAPDDADAKNYLNAANKRKNKLDNEAELVKQSPTAEKYLSLSLLYYNAGRFEPCIEVCNKALLLNPNYDLAYNNICAAYNQLNEWDKAIKAGEEGMRLNPNNQLLKNNLQEAYKHKVK
jgi:tetratricopeptide (TPR) repeat protein